MKITKIFAFLFVLVLLTGMALAKQDDSFTLNEEYAKNLYLTHSDINIKSNLYGDLTSFSDTLKVTATVRDDINAIAGNFILDGTVGSDLRLVSSSAKIDGTVFGEAIILGNYVYLSNTSAIGGSVRINADSVIIDGDLKDNLYVTANKVVLNGIVEGNAVIKASSFELGPDAKILGDLSSSKNVDDVSPQVGGTVTKIAGRESPDSFTSMTFNKIGIFLTLFLIGAVLVVGKKFTEKSSKAVQTRFLLSLMTGFIVIVVAPFVAIFIAFTFVGLPISILMGLAYVALLIVAFGFSAVLVGKAGIKLFKGKKGLWIELLIGALALALLSILASVFWALMIILLLVSVGAMVLVFIKKDKKN